MGQGTQEQKPTLYLQPWTSFAYVVIRHHNKNQITFNIALLAKLTIYLNTYSLNLFNIYLHFIIHSKPLLFTE